MADGCACPACGAPICGARLSFDFDHRCVVGGDRAVELPFTENEILRILHAAAPNGVPATLLDQKIYGARDVVAPYLIRVLISNLRRRLKPLGVEFHCRTGGRYGRDQTIYWLTW